MASSPSPESTFLQPTVGHALRICWAWLWRWVLFGLGGVIVLNVPLMGLSIMAGGTHRATFIVQLLGSVFLIFAAQVYTLWNVVDKDFGSFGLRVVEKGPSPEMSSATPEFVAPSLGKAVRIWWAWFWRQALVSLAVSVPIGLVLGVAMGILGFDKEVIGLVAQAVGVVVGFLVGVFVMKHILNKDFKRFRIRLIPR